MTRLSERRWWLAALAYYGRRLANAVYAVLRRAVLKLLEGLALVPAESVLIEAIQRMNSRRLADELRQSTDRILTLAIAAGALNELDRHAGRDLLPAARSRLTGVLPFLASEWVKIADSFIRTVLGVIRRAGGVLDRIRGKLTPAVLRRRSERIAETETQTAIGYGKEGARTVLYQEGFLNAKEWHSLHDDRVRDTHEHADGQIVGMFDVFTVGGYPARFPGDPALPLHERVNCRCWSTGLHLEPEELAALRSKRAFTGVGV